MKEKLVVLENADKVFLFNRAFGTSMRISKEVYDIIKEAKDIEELKAIASEYPEDGDFFEALIENIANNHILEDGRTDELLKVSYAVTELCNLKCTHCCFSAGALKPGEKIDADIEVLRKIIKANPKEISFTGGEPMSVGNFNELMEVVQKEYSGAATLSTNATLVTTENVHQIVEVFDRFDISLDGVNEETTDKIRGKGSFKIVVEAVKLLRSMTEKPITLSMVIDNETAKYEDEFIALCKELKVEPMIRTMSLVGRAKVNHNDSDEIVRFMKGSTANIVGCYDCVGGMNEIFVNSNGDIYPCINFKELRFKIANIKEDNWIDRLGRDKRNEWYKNFGEYIPDEREECLNCEVRTFCWNCPLLAKAFLESKKIDKLTDICANKKKEIWEAIWSD